MCLSLDFPRYVTAESRPVAARRPLVPRSTSCNAANMWSFVDRSSLQHSTPRPLRGPRGSVRLTDVPKLCWLRHDSHWRRFFVSCKGAYFPQGGQCATCKVRVRTHKNRHAAPPPFYFQPPHVARGFVGYLCPPRTCPRRSSIPIQRLTNSTSGTRNTCVRRDLVATHARHRQWDGHRFPIVAIAPLSGDLQNPSPHHCPKQAKLHQSQSMAHYHFSRRFSCVLAELPAVRLRRSRPNSILLSMRTCLLWAQQ